MVIEAAIHFGEYMELTQGADATTYYRQMIVRVLSEVHES